MEKRDKIYPNIEGYAAAMAGYSDGYRLKSSPDGGAR
jgi:hypothetical protein